MFATARAQSPANGSLVSLGFCSQSQSISSSVLIRTDETSLSEPRESFLDADADKIVRLLSKTLSEFSVSIGTDYMVVCFARKFSASLSDIGLFTPEDKALGFDRGCESFRPVGIPIFLN